MLPESKGDFPKLLYLDQNKWIDLARAHYGRPDGEPFMDALKAVRAATESGRLIAPFSMVNAVEAMIPRDAGRRERLARFMADLSGGRTVLPFPTVFRWEIRNAVHGLFGRPSPLPIRPLVVGAGLPHAIGQSVGFPGLDADTLSAARARLGSPAMTARLLIGVGEGRGLIDLIRERDEAVVGICTRLRGGAGADRGPEAERMAESWSLLFDGGPAAEVLEVAQRDLGFTLPELRGRLGTPEAFGRFADGIPALDVMVTLSVARDRDLVRPIHQNDSRDLIWVSVAMPYSNVVVTENYWGHQVRATGLDTRFCTVLLTDLRELPERLRAMGCIG